MTWTDEAREIIDDLLQELPLPVRDGVRQAAEARAEALAEKSGKVTLDTAVRAFIESTPDDLRQRLKHTLAYKGIDVDDYSELFE